MNGLENLNVGDKVIVKSRHGCKVATVDNNTKAGNIKVDGVIYTPNGTVRGADVWDTTFIYKATPENIEAVRQKAKIVEALRLMHSTTSITFEQAEKICEILKNGVSDEK